VSTFEEGETDALRVPRIRLPRSPLQEALISALEREDTNLRIIYLGALHVLQQEDNPDRLALASHNFRELMDRILHVHIDVEEGGVSLGSKVMNLSDDWLKATRTTSCSNDKGEWEGKIDRPLRRFLRRATDFFRWHEGHRPKQKKEIATVLQKLDPIGLPLPPILEQLNVDTWANIQGFFVKVAHHGDVDEDEFEQWQYACERFLIERLQPRTFEDLARLDELIEKGESHDS